MTSAERIEFYSAGGEGYAGLVEKFSVNIANYVAYKTVQSQGDQYATGEAINYARYGPAVDDSFWDQFGSQIYHNPLGAPIEAASEALSNTGKSLDAGAGKVLLHSFSAWIILAIILVALLIYFGGGGFLRATVKRSLPI